ncbi:3-isopropylmalate dehydratase small subunit [bacterium]|nr:3-isopropylmalate dehydratase small subunit [bacterium]
MTVRIEIQGRAVVIPGDDVDTDRIIPARFLKEITFENMGNYLFQDARFDSDGQPKAHPLNDASAVGAVIMVAGRNFGCGSSREHAPQAIMRYGFQAVIGESFAEIFAGNCKALGIPAVTLSPADLAELRERLAQNPNLTVRINLADKQVQAGDWLAALDLPEARRHSFLAGTWDSTVLLKQNSERIAETAARLPYVGGFKR